jgi:hypothetical protein
MVFTLGIHGVVSAHRARSREEGSVTDIGQHSDEEGNTTVIDGSNQVRAHENRLRHIRGYRTEQDGGWGCCSPRGWHNSGAVVMRGGSGE